MNAQLKAKVRNLHDNNKSLRKAGLIPATVYGAKQESIPIQIEQKELIRWSKSNHMKTKLVVEGKGQFLVSTKEIQKGNMGNQWVHVSFHALSDDIKTTVYVPIEITGKAFGMNEGGIITLLTQEIKVKGYPKDIPEKITVDVTTMKVGDLTFVRDIANQYNCEFFQEEMGKTLVKCEFAKVQILETPKEESATEEGAESTTQKLKHDNIQEETIHEEKKAA